MSAPNTDAPCAAIWPSKALERTLNKADRLHTENVAPLDTAGFFQRLLPSAHAVIENARIDRDARYHDWLRLHDRTKTILAALDQHIFYLDCEVRALATIAGDGHAILPYSADMATICATAERLLEPEASARPTVKLDLRIQTRRSLFTTHAGDIR